MEELANLIASVGFPVACVIALGVFIMKIYDTNCEREERLEAQLKENRDIIARSIEILALYADRLNGIEDDVTDIKNNIVIIKEKMK